MSPFGGDADDPLLDTIDTSLFLRTPGEECTRVQGRVPNGLLPAPVDAVAVGTDNPSHPRELLDALRYETDGARIQRYRTLLRERAGHQPA